MTVAWVMLGGAFYHSLMFDGWVRVDSYVDGHSLVAMARGRRFSDTVALGTESEDLDGLGTEQIANCVGGISDCR